jgi:hypothetical protein
LKGGYGCCLVEKCLLMNEKFIAMVEINERMVGKMNLVEKSSK